jgi:hypothetical protein
MLKRKLAPQQFAVFYPQAMNTASQDVVTLQDLTIVSEGLCVSFFMAED